MDGETPANPANPTASRGQIVVLDGRRAGSLEGIERVAYDGTPLPVAADDLSSAGITTRDIDRGDFPHYLLKEITEAPASFRKTLRGKLVERDGGLAVVLGPEALPDDIRADLRAGAIRRIVVVGQGTAAVAGQALAAALDRFCPDAGLRVGAMPATGPAGRGLRPARAPPRSPASRSPPPSTGSAPTPACGSRPCPPPSCRASGCGRRWPTRWSSPSASRAPPPTPTGRSTSSAPGAPGWWPSSTGGA